jgi:N-acetylcysteine deacetylase
VNALQTQAEKLQQRLVEIRRELHQNPELSMEEFATTKRIEGWLQQIGLPVLDYDLPVGVVTEIVGGKPGPTIAMRADIDALPIKEETGYGFASQTQDCMHACGHDFHTAAVLGAAMLLQEQAAELPGRVRFLFQPGEETAQGAKAMIAAGALKDVQAVFALHNKPDLPVGTVGLLAGKLMASVDRFTIQLRGKGGHAAIPDQARDPIVAASGIVSALQTIVSRRLSALDQVVVSICQLKAGSTWNVIPDHAFLEGTVRTFQPEVRKAMPELMREVIEGLAAGYGVEAEFQWMGKIPSVDNDATIVEIVRRAAKAQHLRVVTAEQSLGGDDFAKFQEQIPGCYWWMGTSGTEEWHHPQFTLDETALSLSASLFAATAMEALQQLR